MSKGKTKPKGQKSKSKKAVAKSNKATKAGLRPRVMISGYYGFDNLGDELILKVLTDELKARDIKITVLSRNPEQTKQQYGVDAISRTNLIDIIDALAQTNLFISGGGGLFQDSTGPASSVYYGGLIHLAHFFEVPVCFWAQGVGPLRGKFSRQMTVSALEKCDAIVVRDEGSAALIEELTDFRPDVTADPVWLLKIPKEKSVTRQTTGNGKNKTSKTPFYIGVSLRPWGELTASRMKALAKALQDYAKSLEKPVEFRLLPFQRAEDTHLLETFAEALRKAGGHEGPSLTLCEPANAIAEVGACDVLFGMRFHSLILALLQDVPAYGLIYDPKVASLVEMFGLQGSTIQSLEALHGEILQEAFAHYPKINLKPFQQKGRINLEVLDELLAIPEMELAL
jgi:polysaccharide pyruvyl transferase CsaB